MARTHAGGRPSKGWEPFSMKMDESAYNKLSELSEKTGLTKTRIVENSICREYDRWLSHLDQEE